MSTPTNSTLDLQGGEHPGPLFDAGRKLHSIRCSLRSSARFRFLRRRTPAWADRSLLKDLELLCKIYNRELTCTTASHDHIVPLRHPLVSGLHCPHNITILPLDANQAKGNSWWPDMPEQQLELNHDE